MENAIIYPEWRSNNENRKYPFSDTATMVSGDIVINNDVFIDARFYLLGATGELFMSSISIDSANVIITVSDTSGVSCSTSFARVETDSTVLSFTDAKGRPSGVLVVKPSELLSFCAPIPSTMTFTKEQTTFASTVVVPMPEDAVNSVLAGSQTALTKEVWLIGGNGVVLSIPDTNTVRMDCVGEPLFVRKNFADNLVTFTPPTFVKKLNSISPDSAGNIAIRVSNTVSTDTVFRITPTTNGIIISMAGVK